MGLFRRNKAIKPQDENASAEKMHNRASHINKNWIIGILAFLVIILSAVILSSDLFKDKNVSTIITFTATILSIVLSLLAILYSYLGNLESFENLSEIRTAVAEIKATEEGIKHFMSNIPFGNGNGPSSKVDDNKETNKTPSNNKTSVSDGNNSSVTSNSTPSSDQPNKETEEKKK